MHNGDLQPKFGPAGNSQAFYDAGFKSTMQTPGWLESMGLDAYEYQCGHGTQVGENTAVALGNKAREHGITVSLHAPYYISLASAEEQKRLNSIRYIVSSAQIVSWMGGNRIVVHPGGLGGLDRASATALASETLKGAQQALDEAGLSHVHICPETMGKINQLGDLDEVLTMCGVDERFIPCIDFGHLNSRTRGGLQGKEDMAAVLDSLTNRLGTERGRAFHAHFSRIEFSAGGEKRHWTFADSQFGPEPLPLMELLAERRLSPVIICESAGTQAADSLTMQAMYREALEKAAQTEE